MTDKTVTTPALERAQKIFGDYATDCMKKYANVWCEQKAK